MNKIWNGKPSGLLGAFFSCLSIIIDRFIVLFSSFLFKNNIKKCGVKPRIHRNVIYRCPSNIMAGNRITVGEGTMLTTELFSEKSILNIEDDVSIGDNCHIDFTGSVEIHRTAHVAHEVILLTHTHGLDYLNTPVGSPLIVGEHAFIGSRSVIMYQCGYIGKNAVVGCGSVVIHDVPDNAVVAGNPAKIIKIIE